MVAALICSQAAVCAEDQPQAKPPGFWSRHEKLKTLRDWSTAPARAVWNSHTVTTLRDTPAGKKICAASKASAQKTWQITKQGAHVANVAALKASDVGYKYGGIAQLGIMASTGITAIRNKNNNKNQTIIMAPIPSQK